MLKPVDTILSLEVLCICTHFQTFNQIVDIFIFGEQIKLYF